MYNSALALLRTMFGPQADFRRHQWEAIEALAVQHRRLLVVERTGWGKSVVYLLATKLLRRDRAGPTLIISPLLSLIRNRLQMARSIGIRAVAIHSGNRAEWDSVEYALAHDACDILLVSPERLNNERFHKSVLPAIKERVGMLAVDEAHCISDWGQDFRPDYRRISRILELLPRNLPIIATTATANHRVTADIRDQLGDDLIVMRGPLARTTLRLQNLIMPDQAVRLAWLAENLPKFPGSGIIYCLTIRDVQLVAGWLISKGIDVRAYHGGQDHEHREALERALIEKQLKALVATAALGMGFERPDLSFVIHFQQPGSVVDYYQQVGRTGCGANKAYGILLCGDEDEGIINHFIESLFQRVEAGFEVLKLLAKSPGMTANEIFTHLHIGHATLEIVLKTLEVDGAISFDPSTGRQRFFRTPNVWKPDIEHIREVMLHRRQELEQMREYVHHDGCLMEFLARALDDPEAKPCGVCANCQGLGLEPGAKPLLINAAVNFLKDALNKR